jgi:hypothetical protein
LFSINDGLKKLCVTSMALLPDLSHVTTLNRLRFGSDSSWITLPCLSHMSNLEELRLPASKTKFSDTVLKSVKCSALPLYCLKLQQPLRDFSILQSFRDLKCLHVILGNEVYDADSIGSSVPSVRYIGMQCCEHEEEKNYVKINGEWVLNSERESDDETDESSPDDEEDDSSVE